MKKNKSNSEHYTWGQKCSGWHFVKSDHLSIIQELMPPNTKEQIHFHHFAEQFFYILHGTATFEIADTFIKVEKGEGLHIKPQIKHAIKNEEISDLEFLLCSSPSTLNDRIEAPFVVSSSINLNGKKFKGLNNTANGEVSEATIFTYRQKGVIIWATYEGGDILFGTLSGRRTDDTLAFTYQHQNKAGAFLTGRCESIVKIINGKIQLHETWQWTCKDFSKGTSILEEII